MLMLKVITLMSPTELSKIGSGHARRAIGFPVIFHVEIESTEQHFLLL